MTSSWLPAATLAVGIVGTLGGQLLSGMLTERREHRARTAQRDIERDALQRDVLIELQDALLTMARHAFQINAHHHRIFGETGRFARDDIPTDLDERSRADMAIVSKLKQRLLDDEVRQRVAEFQSDCASLTSPYIAYIEDSALSDEVLADQARKGMHALAHKFSALEERIGQRLRRVL